jgi:tRNA modification GTPase
MLEYSLDETIIAISTPPGFGGIGIVRLSGKNALPIAKKIFKIKKKDEAGILPRQAIIGDVFDFEKNESLDEAYLLSFPAPRSYTKENVVEISCHGSPAVLEEVVRLGIRAGARHAHPGEFTLRAYLNGRIDILQAEAVNDLIRAASLTEAKIAFGQLEGRLSRRIEDVRDQIVHLLSQIEAAIEFPDEHLRITPQKITLIFERMIEFLEALVASYDAGKALTEGVTLAIAGRKNVGKSTLFNALLEEQRAIVTPHPGTTRDYLKEKVKIKDTIFNLVDMAGLGRPSSVVEKEGMKKGRKIARQAAGLLVLLDASRTETAEDYTLIEEYKGKNMLLVFNKIDLRPKMDMEKIKKRYGTLSSLRISALRGTNLSRLKDNIYDLFAPKVDDRQGVIFHLRQKLQLEEILNHLKKGRELLENKFPEEVYVEEIRKVLPAVGQLTGEIHADEVIDDIFSRFCVGK